MKLDREKTQLAMAQEALNNRMLSERTDLSYQTIVGAMIGKELSLPTVGRIAKALNVHVREIVLDANSSQQ